jgi:hypothetical protein
MTSPYGKVHRINPDGSTPSDNPYFDTTPGMYNANGVLKTIYASGLRNPWRGAYDPVADMFLIGEVGGNDHTTAWEDTHVLSSGANFGWPLCGATGRDGQGMCTDPQYDDPVLTYPHAGTGACVTGGTFYRNGTWPNDWEGRYLYADFVRGWIRYMEFDAAGNVIDDQPVVDTTVYPGLSAGFTAKFLQGPDGNIYYIKLYDSFVSGSGSVHRLEYNVNQLPTCDTAWATPSFGPGPNLTVTFGGAGSDSQNDSISYLWTFGDGSPPADSADPIHIYSGYGSYTAELLVSDGLNSVPCGAIDIQVGQPPSVQITTPSDSSFFQAGQTISFESVFADDGPISAADLEWVVVFNHDEHIHPVAGAVGTDDYDLIIPTTGHDYSGNTWYTVTVIATDSDGLQSISSVRIYPEKRLLTLNSNPPGLEVIVDGLPYITPYVVDHAIGTELFLTVPNNQQCQAGSGYLFDQWNGGYPMNYVYQMPATASTVTAEFVLDGLCDHCGSALDFDGADDIVTTDSVWLSGDVTIEFWLDLDPAISASDVIIGNGDDLSIDMAGGKLSVYHNGPIAQSSIVAAPNQWKHYALVRNAGVWSFYIDGVLDVGSSGNAHVDDFYFNRLGQSFRNDGLNGSLDEFRIWNTARTQTQIVANLDRLVDPLSPDLAVYWRFDLAPGTQNMTDLSGNGHLAVAGADNYMSVDEPTIFTPNGPMTTSCTRSIPIDVKVWLQGPYDETNQLMTDDLRVQSLIPLSEPYTALSFNTPGAGGETIDASVLGVSGPNAIVDWIVVDIRDSDDPSEVIASKIGLLQRDGDIVALNGVSLLDFVVDRPDYKLAVRHRNHLGVMVADELVFGTSFNPVLVDFRDPNLSTFGVDARKEVNNEALLWAGDAVHDGIIRYTGANNDRDAVLQGIGGSIPTAVLLDYSNLDVNLDGLTKYAGSKNDRDIMLVNIGGSVPTATRSEQLP